MQLSIQNSWYLTWHKCTRWVQLKCENFTSHYIKAPKEPVYTLQLKLPAAQVWKFELIHIVLTSRSDQKAYSQPFHQCNFPYQGDEIHWFYASDNEKKNQNFHIEYKLYGIFWQKETLMNKLSPVQ